MEERYQGEAEFGEDPIVSGEELIDDEVVLDDVPEEEDGEEYEDDSQDSDEYNPEIKQRDKAQVRINRLTKERYKAENKAKKALSDADYWRHRHHHHIQPSARKGTHNFRGRSTIDGSAR